MKEKSKKMESQQLVIPVFSILCSTVSSHLTKKQGGMVTCRPIQRHLRHWDPDGVGVTPTAGGRFFLSSQDATATSSCQANVHSHALAHGIFQDPSTSKKMLTDKDKENIRWRRNIQRSARVMMQYPRFFISFISSLSLLPFGDCLNLRCAYGIAEMQQCCVSTST